MTTASEHVVIPQADVPAPPVAPATEVPAEIAYLRQHGLESEAASLASELEGLLKARDNAPAITPVQAPITQVPPTPAPDGPVLPPAPAPQTSQEKALDPYAVDGAEVDDSSVVIDAEGRARDAQTGRYVPLKALRQEREQHKQTRQQLQETKELNARVEERLAILNEILAADEKPGTAAPAEPIAPPPVEEFVDPEVDIFKFAKQMQEHAKRQNEYIKKLEEKVSGTEQLTRQQIEGMQADQAIRSDLTSHVARNPHFLPAYNHLRQTRDKALEALGYADQAAREAQIAREERGLAADALKNKKSYAEVIYNLALAYGFQPPAPKADPTPEPAPAPPPAAPTVDPAAAAKIESIRNGKELAGASLTGAGGSAAEGLTVQQLANMNEHDFLNLAAKLGGKGRLDTLLRGA